MRLPLTHAIASALAATLLFAVQPWAAKLLLPWFGGSASVWLTSLLFFQVAVVAGYLYAHLVSSAPRAVHLAWCLAAAGFVPIAVAPHHLGLPAVAEVLVALAAGLGIVVVLVSATTPLLHTWLAAHDDDQEPYALYAVSNAGSLVGLLAYPLVVEPFVELADQSDLWRVLFVMLALALVASARVQRQFAAPELEQEVASESSSPRRWFVYSFVPASLLYGFTGFITRDIAALPLIWVGPLAIYLVTFIVSFKRSPLLLPAWFAWAGPLLLYVTAVITVVWPSGIITLLAHLAAFGAFALYFHGELSRSRPGSSEATSFYLWVSFGGVAGGLFNAVLAPLLFTAPMEYPLTYGLALILIPAGYVTTFAPTTRRALHATMMVALAVAFAFAPGGWAPKLGAGVMMLLAFVVALGLPALSHVMLAIFLGAVVSFPGDAKVIEQRRSFYGSHTVEQRTTAGVDTIGLADGITLHGHERASGEVEPLGYYHDAGPCGEVVRDVAKAGPMRVALVGLGVGSMALYSRPGDDFLFFELDPVVVELAKTQFRSLASATGDVRIEVADGRLGLQASAERFDLIVIDAFSSDAIPTHLLTLEAFELYGERLSPKGRLLLHTSNRFLDVDRVAVGALEKLGWAHRQRHWDPGADLPFGAWPSSWIVAAPAAAALGVQEHAAEWQVLRSDLVWTDGYSSLLQALR